MKLMRVIPRKPDQTGQDGSVGFDGNIGLDAGIGYEASIGYDASGFSNDHAGLLRPSEVAEMFRVDPKTVTRWANDGKLSAIRTLGGHRRFREEEVMELRVATGRLAQTAA